MGRLAKSNLRQLIIVLVVLSILATVVNMYIAGARVQKQSLFDNTLQHNQGYAKQLAQSLQVSLEIARDRLDYAAYSLSRHWSEPLQVQHILTAFSARNSFFDSMYVASLSGSVLATSRSVADMNGQILSGEVHEQALRTPTAWVSQLHVSPFGALAISMMAPVLTDRGQILGYLAGNIHLEEENLLYRLIGEHYQQDGSYIYIIDQQKRLLYHPDRQRLGTPTHTNPLLDVVLQGGSGSQPVTNSLGYEMLAGYAYIPLVDWGLVSQRPARAVLEAHSGLMREIMWNSMPYNFAGLLLIWFLAGLISWPLRVLAVNAKKMTQRKTIGRIENLKAWYFEAQELKQALLFGLQNIHAKVDKLQHDVDIDPLTGLSNRRILKQVLDAIAEEGSEFCAIMFDIDHFKSVNDTWGHAVGDQVLQGLAHVLLAGSRDMDVCIRFGGEEFLILMRRCPINVAMKVAERLRQDVMNHDFPGVGQVTISLGVAAWPLHGATTDEVLKVADEMLYRAKREGRNRVCCASDSA